MTTLFGIKNCDTVKKARQWLDTHGIAYTFHDVRSDGLTKEQLEHWAKALGWQTLVNRRSTTWRTLSDDIKANLTESSAIEVILDNPTLMKRPVVEYKQTAFAGFKAEDYQTIFANEANK